MTHPLENYKIIANSNFILQAEENFYSSYFNELNAGLYAEIDKENDRIKVTGVDFDGKDFSEYISFSFYFLTEYNKLEADTRSNFYKIILQNLDEKKQQVFVKGIVAELQVLQNAITQILLTPKYEVYKSILLDKIKLFSSNLSEIYLTNPTLSITKIQWLGKTNVLATLIYDLWQGQDKGKEPSTRPLIQAQKKDLEALLINNFIDAKGKPLTESTISDYLNTSKPEKRPISNFRIKLNY
jgi:hypothetical protein